jgi:hypothetical protein
MSMLETENKQLPTPRGTRKTNFGDQIQAPRNMRATEPEGRHLQHAPAATLEPCNVTPRQQSFGKTQGSTKGRQSLSLAVTQESIVVRDQKLLRMRATLLDSTPRSARNPVVRSRVVPPIVPAPILSRRRDHPLESYLTIKDLEPDFGMLEPLPNFTNKDAQLSSQQRAGNHARRKHTVGQGMVPFLKSIGCRPQSVRTGPSRNLFTILSEGGFPCDASLAVDSRAVDRATSLEPVGPNHIQFAFTAEIGSSEKDWWVRPALLEYVSDRVLRFLPQHLMRMDAWARAVMVLCNLHFLACKIQRYFKNA